MPTLFWRHPRPGSITLVAMLMAAGCATDLLAAAQEQKEVLVVYSQRRDARLVIVGDVELPRVLEQGLAEGVDYYSEFLDNARFHQPGYRSAFSAFLKSKYSDKHFDLVIAMGEDPLAFLTASRDALHGAPPLVYFTDRPVERPPNSAGLLGRLNLSSTVALATELQPDIENVFVVVGAGAPAMREAAREQLRQFEPRLSIVFLSGLPTVELEKRLASLPPHSIVYYLVVDRDGANELFHPLDYLLRVTAKSIAPVYSWVDSAMDHGIVGGSLKDQVAQTQAVGRLALRVLNGEAAGSIPIVEEHLTSLQVDWRQLQRWHIAESRLPAGTIVRYRQPSFGDRFAPYLAAAALLFLAQTALIAGLLIQRSRRRRAEAEVLTNQHELSTSHDQVRDLGARLLKAQETERARLARELHDDISQQVALLRMDLEQLDASVEGQAASLTDEALQRTTQIAKSVHDLSHRLHPAKLRLIGLVAALHGLRRELSHHGIEITFNHDQVPQTLPEELAVCLFRIVQEALHNAIKYSRGQHVLIDLRGKGNGLALTVVDDGVGFEIDPTWRKGLGLISMRERLEMVGGSIEIHTKPGAGTRVEVAVPLRLDPTVAA